ncbi:hypothetical protein E2C01_029893 [Portunus trituberculatus]|uniref:C-type lectin domain-containing protein n=1 Tax=Portunus trituberculatus TaxID=210409 RepID=A0A5B7ESM7_PORTR|nr:hypothetical protein [Portunus trituberculatus]
MDSVIRLSMACGKSFYRLSTTPKAWREAQEDCLAGDGRVAVVVNSVPPKLASRLAALGSPLWVGSRASDAVLMRPRPACIVVEDHLITSYIIIGGASSHYPFWSPPDTSKTEASRSLPRGCARVNTCIVRMTGPRLQPLSSPGPPNPGPPVPRAGTLLAEAATGNTPHIPYGGSPSDLLDVEDVGGGGRNLRESRRAPSECWQPLRTPSPPQTCEGDPAWLRLGNHCYRLVGVEDQQPWGESNKRCLEEGAILASVHSLEENYWLQAKVSRSDWMDG